MFTAVLAVTLFGERLTRVEAVAIITVIAGAVLMSWTGGPLRAETFGAAAIAAACLAWGIDNNLTARLSARNPVDLVRFKALAAGMGNLALAVAAGRSLPASSIGGMALALGFVSYGLSIVLDVYALRYVGAAREAAFFATAPFAGAIAAVPLLGERVPPREIVGGCVMAVGVVLLVFARRRQIDA